MDDWTFYSYFCFFILDTDEYFNDFILALTERNQRLDIFCDEFNSIFGKIVWLWKQVLYNLSSNTDFYNKIIFFFLAWIDW